MLGVPYVAFVPSLITEVHGARTQYIRGCQFAQTVFPVCMRVHGGKPARERLLRVAVAANLGADLSAHRLEFANQGFIQEIDFERRPGAVELDQPVDRNRFLPEEAAGDSDGLLIPGTPGAPTEICDE